MLRVSIPRRPRVSPAPGSARFARFRTHSDVFHQRSVEDLAPPVSRVIEIMKILNFDQKKICSLMGRGPRPTVDEKRQDECENARNARFRVRGTRGDVGDRCGEHF